MSERDVECRTPDGRYLVVRGRLWRATNPHLPEPDKERLVTALMNARRQLRGKRSAVDRRGRASRCRRGQGCPRRARSGVVG